MTTETRGTTAAQSRPREYYDDGSVKLTRISFVCDTLDAWEIKRFDCVLRGEFPGPELGRSFLDPLSYLLHVLADVVEGVKAEVGETPAPEVVFQRGAGYDEIGLLGGYNV